MMLEEDHYDDNDDDEEKEKRNTSNEHPETQQFEATTNDGMKMQHTLSV